MATEVSIQTERVDDLPLLVWQQRVMGIPQIIDEIIQPHGNRRGLSMSIGWTVVGWLSYILSQADNRLSYVESWAAEQSLLDILAPDPEDQDSPVPAQAYKTVRQQEILHSDKLSSWQERVLGCLFAYSGQTSRSGIVTAPAMSPR